MRRIVLALVTAGLLAACGGQDANQPASNEPAPMEGHGDMSGSTQPPDGAAARTVEVTAGDNLRFEPANLSVKRGETITFRVTNAGKLVHEFVVGDQAFQDRHGEEMAGMTMPMHDDADGIGLPAGTTKTLTHTFDHPETIYFGCHVTGHYQAGMKGTITVS